MILLFLIVILLIGGLLALLSGQWSLKMPGIISLVAVFTGLMITVYIAFNQDLYSQSTWMIDYGFIWIQSFGIGLHLALDGLSLLMLILTFFLGIVAIIISLKGVKEKIGFYYFNLMIILAGITGVFLAMDLFLFYFFWELILIPMFFMIGIWGGKNRTYASYKFFIFTQASGLLMFLAILGLYFVHGANTGVYTFDYMQLLGTKMSESMAMVLMLGFLIAFIVKLPIVPFHSWVPDAITEAPIGLVLTGLLLKTGAYGILRFVVPLFPSAVVSFTPIAMILGVVTILYGAKLAFAQTDLNRLIAYTGISHMGFVLIGIFAFNEMAYQGVVMQMIVHCISSGALFILIGQLYERMQTRDLSKMGGLWAKVPLMGAMGLIFSMATLGLPGFGNFIAEFLILMGTFKVSVWTASLASIGLVVATVYSLRIVQKVFLGHNNFEGIINDLSIREKIVSGIFIIAIIWMGIMPQPILNTVKPSLLKILNAKENYHNEPIPNMIDQLTNDKKSLEANNFDNKK